MLLLAIEVITDTFRTVGNVTADMAVTAIVARREPGSDEETRDQAEREEAA